MNIKNQLLKINNIYKKRILIIFIKKNIKRKNILLLIMVDSIIDNIYTNRIMPNQNVKRSCTRGTRGYNLIVQKYPNTPLPSCYSANKNDSVTLNNVVISGCQCCSVVITQSATTGKVFN
jgi:hypothetical protein